MTARDSLLRSPVALLLLALALVTRVALPPGMMPGAGGTITLCTATGLQHVTVDKDGKPTPTRPGETCPFGAAAAPPLTPTPPVVPTRVAMIVALRPAPTFATIHGCAVRTLPPARAPPVQTATAILTA